VKGRNVVKALSFVVSCIRDCKWS